MSQAERSGPRHRGRPTYTDAVQSAVSASVTQGVTPVTARVTPVTVAALLFPATGRRQLDVAVVTRCPWCSAGHVHRGDNLDGAVRDSGCQPARAYQLAVAS